MILVKKKARWEWVGCFDDEEEKSRKNNYKFWKWLEPLTIIENGSIVDIYQGS